MNGPATADLSNRKDEDFGASSGALAHPDRRSAIGVNHVPGDFPTGGPAQRSDSIWATA